MVKRLQVLQPPVQSCSSSHGYLPSSTKRVSRSASFCLSHARISSILVGTNSARLRLSFGGIGGNLVNKFVKQTKINSGFAYECSLDQVPLVEAKPNEGHTAKVRKMC